MQIYWYQIIFQIINFSILIFVLNKFLYQPVVKSINDRNKKMQDGIKAAENNLAEKAKLKEFKKKIQLEAQKEATVVLNKAKQQAEVQTKELLSTAKQDAQKMVAKEFENLKEKLKDEEAKIKENIGGLVAEATTKVLGDALTATDQKKLIDKELKLLEKVI